MSAKKKRAAGGDDAEVVTDDAAGDFQDNLSDAEFCVQRFPALCA